MRERRSQLTIKPFSQASLVILLGLFSGLLLFPEAAEALKSPAPAKTDSQSKDKKTVEKKNKKWSDDDSESGNHKMRGDDDSEGEHHRRRHGNGERRHGRKGNWGDKDESRNGHRRKLHILDDDYKMEQIWKLPGLGDKQRAKIVEIERNFYSEVRPMRKEYKGIKQELESSNLRISSDAGAEIGGAVMSSSAKFGTDTRRDPGKSLEPREPGNPLTGSKRKVGEKASAEQEKKWHRSDQLEDDPEEPSYKSARNSALYKKMKLLRRKMKALKEKSWVEIRTVLTDKQKAVLAKQ